MLQSCDNCDTLGPGLGLCYYGDSINSQSTSGGLRVVALAVVLAMSGCGKPNTSGDGSAGVGDPQTAAVSDRLAAIAAAGEPVTLDDLDRMYQEPPPALNAAPLYKQAFAVLATEDVKSATYLAHNQQAEALLLEAAKRPSCRYPVALTNGCTTLLPHLAGIKASAKLLQQEAISQAARGTTDAATADLLAGFQLARSLDHEPVLISKLVQFASLTSALEGLEQSLTHKAFTDAQLESLENALRDTEAAVSLRRAMLAERAGAVAVFQSSDAQLAQALAVNGGGAARTSDIANYRKMGYLQTDFAFALDYLSNMVAVAEMPYPQALDAAAGLKAPDAQTAVQEKRIVSGILLPALANAFEKGAEAVARIRIARTVLAVERYRLQHGGALPVSLDDLAGGVPADPFDGQPLRYKRLPARGYAVYSVGKDRKDDGGEAKAADGKPPFDLMMSIGR